MSAVPVTVWDVDPPLNSISPAPECVALFVTFPFTVIINPPSANVSPAVAIVKLPAIVNAEAAVFVPDAPVMVKLL